MSKSRTHSHRDLLFAFDDIGPVTQPSKHDPHIPYTYTVSALYSLYVLMVHKYVVHHPTPVNVNGQHIEIVHSYKYLGTTIDDKLRWDDNTMNLYEKGQQILYFLKKLNALHIDRNILFVFHDSFVKKSVMPFGLVCWWGNLSGKNRE